VSEMIETALARQPERTTATFHRCRPNVSSRWRVRSAPADVADSADVADLAESADLAEQHPAASTHGPNAVLADRATDPNDQGITSPLAAVEETGRAGDLHTGDHTAAAGGQDVIDRSLLRRQPVAFIVSEGAGSRSAIEERHRSESVHWLRT
jgi:hypothetical protein